MYTVNENVPATRVVRVSDMKTADFIEDDAFFMGVQNGKCFKTSYDALKNQICTQLDEHIQTNSNKLKNDIDKKNAMLSSTYGNIEKKLDDQTSKQAKSMYNIQQTVAQLSSTLAEIKNSIVESMQSLQSKVDNLGYRIDATENKITKLSAVLDSITASKLR